MEQLLRAFDGQDDLKNVPCEYDSNVCNLIYLDTLVNPEQMAESIVFHEIVRQRPISRQQAVNLILNGSVVLYTAGQFREVPMKKCKLNRQITAPHSVNVVQDAFDSFIEDYQTNIALIRKKTGSSGIRVKILEKSSPSVVQKVAVIHIPSASSGRLADRFIRLVEHHPGPFRNVQDLLRLFGPQWFMPVQSVYPTELPGEALNAMEEGRIVCFLNGFPYAMIIPGIMSDYWRLREDRNHPMFIANAIRLFRIVSIFLALITPSAYISLVSINPEILRIHLALSIAQTRENVPYPAIIEILLMMMVIDLIIEASIRMPKSIGPTVTMVGGIVLGEAAVSAQLVSNLLIIIISVTTIANFSVNGYQNYLSLRLYKYALLFVSSIFGLIGLFVGIVWIVIMIGSVRTLGVPYATWKFQEGRHS